MKQSNFFKTMKALGYTPRRQTPAHTYGELGFKCGLEVHQQLNTAQKLFCHCPAGVFQKFGDYDAEVLRHMRPTLSELGEYDGTALMEFRTRKNIIYRIKDRTTCTYEIDDTPPFPLNRQALEYGLEVALMLKLNIVGEVHIIRKQYLDGSIPTGFQRTAILGIEGEIPLSNKKVKIIQLSIEEDSCREVSDIGHNRTYTTDRLGMPLIETVTYPELLTPEEAAEAAYYVRFLARSSGRVRVGMGAAREDVNVSITGGTRIEIKGVAHIAWIPELVHNEAFRQKALLAIKAQLAARGYKKESWKLRHVELDPAQYKFAHAPLTERVKNGEKLVAVCLPGFKNLLSHFTQPGLPFAEELAGRLKVIACLERPNMLHNDDVSPKAVWKKAGEELQAGTEDALLVFWAPADDIATALIVLSERCQMAFDGVPSETRKALADGTTIFERVLPGADRMYPDTDSAPIPLSDEYITGLGQNLPPEVSSTVATLAAWGVPAEQFTYVLRNNLMPLVQKIVTDHGADPAFVCRLLAQRLKNLQGTIVPASAFAYQLVYDLFAFVTHRGLHPYIIWEMLPYVYAHPKVELASVLNMMEYSKHSADELKAEAVTLAGMFKNGRRSHYPQARFCWIMGRLRKKALGNVDMADLAKTVRNEVIK